MNRNALLIYLHDLRDLEAAKYQIEKMRKNNLAANKSATGKIQSEINAINTANYMKKPYWPFSFSDITDELFGTLFVLVIVSLVSMVVGGVVSVVLLALHMSTFFVE